MWKLPSPSVVCAQNSPVIFTDRLWPRVVDLDLVLQQARALAQRVDVVVAAQLIEKLAGGFVAVLAVASTSPSSVASAPP